jgi:hypothetical protein
MKRTAVFLIPAALISPALADGLPHQGGAPFADGRGHISFETGSVYMSVDPVRADGYIAVDGVPVAFSEGVDHVDGRLYAGELTYVLPGEDEPSWFGRNLRVFGGYEHQMANAAERLLTLGLTVNDGIDVTSVSSDGRAFASSSSHLTYADAQVGFFSPVPSVGLLCTLASGANSASAFQDAGFGNTITCAANANGATSQIIVNQSGFTWAATANAAVLAAPTAMEMLTYSSYSVIARGGEAGFAGDHQISPDLTLSPSVSVAIGERRADFGTLQGIFDDADNPQIGAQRIVSGNLDTRDGALRLGLRGQYAAGSGFDLFAGVGGAVVRRKTDMTVTSVLGAVTPNGTTAAVVFANGDQTVRRSDTIAAFQGTFELGAGYAFDPAIGIGPLKLSLTGGFTYDSDVPTYGNMGAISGPLSAPIAPATLAYSDETTLTLKGAITFELP